MVRSDLWYEFRKISYSNHVTCLNCNDLNKIERDTINLFESEGYRHISRPPLPQNYKPLLQILRSSYWDVMSYLWVIALSAGNYDWTVLKTSVPELFCHKSRYNNYPLLSGLA